MCRWQCTLLASVLVSATVWTLWRRAVASAPVGRVTAVSHAPPPPTFNASGYGAHNFRRPNRVVTEYDPAVARRLASLVDRQATAADPELIRLIVDLLDPPSTHMVKMSRQLITTPQSREVDIILNNKVQPSPVAHV